MNFTLQVVGGASTIIHNSFSTQDTSIQKQIFVPLLKYFLPAVPNFPMRWEDGLMFVKIGNNQLATKVF